MDFSYFLMVGLGVLGFFFTVGSLACWINTLSPAFERSLILGALCFVPPIAFLWGWVKAGEAKLRTNMFVWTICALPTIAFLIFVPTLAEHLGHVLEEGLQHTRS